MPHGIPPLSRPPTGSARPRWRTRRCCRPRARTASFAMRRTERGQCERQSGLHPTHLVASEAALGLLPVRLLQSAERAKQHADGMAPADRVARLFEILPKVRLRVARRLAVGVRRARALRGVQRAFASRESDCRHAARVQAPDGRVDRDLGRGRNAAAQRNGMAWSGFVARVAKALAPACGGQGMPGRLVSASHQWQKSELTTKKVSLSARYGARSWPKCASFVGEMEPTRIGTILICCLEKTCQCSTAFRSTAGHALPPDMTDVRQVQLDAVLLLVGIQGHVAELAGRTQLGDRWAQLSARSRRAHGPTHSQGPAADHQAVSGKSRTCSARSRRDKRDARDQGRIRAC